MTVTITPVLAGTDTYIADVATDGTDLTMTVPHGLGAAPLEVMVSARTADVNSIAPFAATTIDTTNVVLTRHATGAAAATVRLVARRPHSIGK
mgnify:CR=1 FL=1